MFSLTMDFGFTTFLLDKSNYCVLDGKQKMPDYLVLLKVDSKRLREAIGRLRNLPEKPRPGVKLRYTLEILGDWDLGLLINTSSEDNALDFLNEDMDEIPGVVRAYILSGSPHSQMQKKEKQ